MTALATCEGVAVAYGDADRRVLALDHVDFTVAPGEQVALRGRSGSGKTTLLHAIGGLLVPTDGVVSWRGAPLSSLDAAARSRARARGIAYVFQGANLLPTFTAFENVAFALHASRSVAQTRRAAVPDAASLLTLVGLHSRMDALPAELSGGEAQRVAIARAIAQGAELVLCDEPTGHLDRDTGVRMLDLLAALQERFGFAMVTATHDSEVAARSTREVELFDGHIVTPDEVMA